MIHMPELWLKLAHLKRQVYRIRIDNKYFEKMECAIH